MARRITNLSQLIPWLNQRHCKDAVALPSKKMMVGPEREPCRSLRTKDGPRSAARFRQYIQLVSGFVLVAMIFTDTLSLFAQQTEEATRSISFWAYRVGNGNWSDIHFEAGINEVDTLSLGKYMKGRIHEYQGPDRLLFFREQPDPQPNDPNKVIRIPIAQTQIPSGVQEAILILTVAPPDSPNEFVVHFVPADSSNFPGNSIRVFNSTGVRLVEKVGKDNMYFDPGVSQPFSLAPYLNKGIPVAFLVETKEGPKFVFEKELEYANNRRVILLLEAPRRKGSYKIQATNLIEMVE